MKAKVEEDAVDPPTTGATHEQILRAAERRFNFVMTGSERKILVKGTNKLWDSHPKRGIFIRDAMVHAHYLIPVGHAVTPVGEDK